MSIQRAVRYQHSVEAILPALQVTEVLPGGDEEGVSAEFA